MKNGNNKTRLIKERQEAVKKIQQRLETLDIGNEIRSVLNNHGISEQYLADIIYCERSNVSKICKRKNNMDLVQLILISVALQYNFLDKISDLLKTEQKEFL